MRRGCFAICPGCSNVLNLERNWLQPSSISRRSTGTMRLNGIKFSMPSYSRSISFLVSSSIEKLAQRSNCLNRRGCILPEGEDCVVAAIFPACELLARNRTEPIIIPWTNGSLARAFPFVISRSTTAREHTTDYGCQRVNNEPR